MSAVALFPTSLRIAEEEKDSSTMKKIPWWFPFPWDILVPLEASDLYKWYHWLFWRISTTQKSILSWSQHRKPSLWSSQWQGERSRLVPFWTVSYVRRLLNSWCEPTVIFWLPVMHEIYFHIHQTHVPMLAEMRLTHS